MPCALLVEQAEVPTTRTTADRADRLRRLGFELADASGPLPHPPCGEQGRRHGRRLFGLNLAGVEQWIREQVQAH